MNEVEVEESGKKVEVGGPGQGGVLEQLVEDQDNQKYLFSFPWSVI